jgi:hypothetical protein
VLGLRREEGTDFGNAEDHPLHGSVPPHDLDLGRVRPVVVQRRANYRLLVVAVGTLR